MYEDQPQHNGVKQKHTDTITAANMRVIAENNINLKLGIEIERWLFRIEEAAKANNFSATIPETISDACKKHLESRGFKVKTESTYDQRDREKWDSTTVSW